MNKRKTIFLISTHDYLFRTTGSFFLKKISGSANVYVFSNQPGLSTIELKKIGAEGSLYFKSFKDLYRLFNFIKNSKKSDELIVLSPNFRLSMSFYISVFSRLLYKKVKLIEYLNAATTVKFNVEKHWEYRKRLGRPFISHPFKILYKILKGNIEGNSVLGKIFTSLPYVLAGFTDFKNRRILVYFIAEYHSLKSKGMNPVLIDHPFEFKLNSVKRSENQQESVLIAPSFLGFFEDGYEHKIINKWIKYIKAISANRKHKIILKLHPRGKKSSVNLLKEKISNITNIEIIDSNSEIWPLIDESEIIITETSSIAWQALIHGSKRLFLLNIDKDLPHYMDDYVDITHIHDHDGLKFYEVCSKIDDTVNTYKLHDII
jgi:hypothetical protein